MNEGSERDSSHLGWLKREIEGWRAAGIVSDEQAEAVLSRYPNGEEHRARVAFYVSLFAVVLIGAGILSFIAANWAGMAPSSRISLILAGMAVFYGVGAWFRWRRDLPILGNSLLLLGGVTYGAGVWLIGQTYHLNADWPLGFFLWFLGLLPLALVTRWGPIVAVTSAILTLWALMPNNDPLNWLFGFSGRQMSQPWGVLIGYPLLCALVMAPLSVRARSQFSLAMTALGFIVFAGAVAGQTTQFDRPEYTLVAALLASVVVFGWAGLMSGEFRAESARAYRAVGLLGALGALIALGSTSLANEGARTLSEEAGRGTLVVWLVTLTAIALLVTILADMRSSAPRRGESATAFSVLAAAWLFLASFAGLIPGLDPISGAWFAVILANILFFGAAVGALLRAAEREEHSAVNLILLLFAIAVIWRYGEWGWAAMDKSLFFIGLGVLLLGGGWWLERSRRRLLSKGVAA